MLVKLYVIITLTSPTHIMHLIQSLLVFLVIISFIFIKFLLMFS